MCPSRMTGLLKVRQRISPHGQRTVAIPATQRFSSGQTRASDERLLYPDSPTDQHSDLASFTAYATRTGLNMQSTVYKGTHYEYTVAASLSRYGFQLKRVGGALDRGTDLLGTWTPPATSQCVKVLLQCKAGTQRVGPQHIRELEGTFVGAPPGWRGNGVLAFVVGEVAATKGVRDALGRSQLPMGFICCSRQGLVRQMLWNKRAEEEGLEGLMAVARHSATEEKLEIALLRGDKILPMLKTSTVV